MSGDEKARAINEALACYDRLNSALDEAAFRLECAGLDVRATVFMDARDELAVWFKEHLSAEFDEKEL